MAAAAPTDRTGAQALVLVTRPEDSGSGLAEGLRAEGCAALWWPAFDLLAPEDPQVLEALVRRLERFDLAVFVSPAAVRAFATALRRLSCAWPAGTRIAAVGTATGQAARTELTGAGAAQILCPAGAQAAAGGSEALIERLQALRPAPRFALIVRAQSGRERLAEWLRSQGAAVEEASAYRRAAHVPGAAQWSALREGLAPGRTLAVLYTSSEAVAAVAAQFEGQAEFAAPFAASTALCIHARIEAALRGRGWRDVRRCDPQPGSIRAALLAKGTAPPLAGSAPRS